MSKGMAEVVGFVGLGAMGLGMAANVQRLLRSEKGPILLASEVCFALHNAM